MRGRNIVIAAMHWNSLQVVTGYEGEKHCNHAMHWNSRLVVTGYEGEKHCNRCNALEQSSGSNRL